MTPQERFTKTQVLYERVIKGLESIKPIAPEQAKITHPFPGISRHDFFDEDAVLMFSTIFTFRPMPVPVNLVDRLIEPVLVVHHVPRVYSEEDPRFSRVAHDFDGNSIETLIPNIHWYWGEDTLETTTMGQVLSHILTDLIGNVKVGLMDRFPTAVLGRNKRQGIEDARPEIKISVEHYHHMTLEFIVW